MMNRSGWLATGACWVVMLAVVSLILVPWNHVAPGDRLVRSAGYAPLLMPPAPPVNWRASVDGGRFGVELVAVTALAPILGFGLSLILARPSRTPPALGPEPQPSGALREIRSLVKEAVGAKNG